MVFLSVFFPIPIFCFPRRENLPLRHYYRTHSLTGLIPPADTIHRSKCGLCCSAGNGIERIEVTDTRCLVLGRSSYVDIRWSENAFLKKILRDMHHVGEKSICNESANFLVIFQSGLTSYPRLHTEFFNIKTFLVPFFQKCCSYLYIESKSRIITGFWPSPGNGCA